MPSRSGGCAPSCAPPSVASHSSAPTNNQLRGAGTFQFPQNGRTLSIWHSTTLQRLPPQRAKTLFLENTIGAPCRSVGCGPPSASAAAAPPTPTEASCGLGSGLWAAAGPRGLQRVEHKMRMRAEALTCERVQWQGRRPATARAIRTLQPLKWGSFLVYERRQCSTTLTWLQVRGQALVHIKRPHGCRHLIAADGENNPCLGIIEKKGKCGQACNCNSPPKPAACRCASLCCGQHCTAQSNAGRHACACVRSAPQQRSSCRPAHSAATTPNTSHV